MKYTNLGKYSRINEYVKHRLSLLEKEDFSFAYLFDIMFEEKENTLFEESVGFLIKKITYGEAKENAIKNANALRKIIGDAPKDSVIGINLDNSHHWIEVFWAILKAGCRPLLLNKRLDTLSLNKALETTKAILVISDDEKKFNVKTIRLEDLEIDAPQYDGEFGEELFVMSSGTTNNIKICAYGASELQYILKQSKHIVMSNRLIKKHYKGELKLLAFLPFYHIFGFVALYLWFGFYSRTFVRLNDLSPATIQATIKRHHVTHIFAVPLFWQKTYDSAMREAWAQDKYFVLDNALTISKIPLIGKPFRKFAFKQLREKLFGNSVYFMITGGSVINKETLSFFNYIGYHLANGYGMTEVGITSVELSNNLKHLSRGSIGKPLPYVNYRIDEEGTLFVSSKAMSRYIIEGDRTINNKDKEYFTHDISKVIGDRYYLEGREDDLLVAINGENINPNIIESQLNLRFTNGQCLILDEATGSPVLLISVSKYISPIKVEAIKFHLSTEMATNGISEQQIGKVEFITSPLIKGDEFKINRKRLQDDYFHHRLEILDLESHQEEIDDQVSLKVKEFFSYALGLKAEDIKGDLDFFADYGGTSIDFAIVDQKIREEFGFSILTDEEIKHTVTDIASFIKTKL